ncbi:uncharacterized protein SOCE26_035810 [Sorangium cellulosum]|uniref:N-acetyltransferase domain-containing protein n=1 Tax=Sorangium cellulosum TaxID=56 RepID=A0A2L0ES95_SORCE|nr:hypothetical protein [Sorangium cellulosum]AUX42154.1 uncharacterized protein SOCE26_035810 [Sorangium cellulosum]
MSTTNNSEDLIDEDELIESYDVRFTVERTLAATGEPSDYVIEIHGDIRIDSNHNAPEAIGWIQARRVQAGRACNDGESLFEVCDSVDQSLHEYASAVYDYEEESILDSISDGCVGADILIVESIQIVAAHRGRRLGLLAMRRTVDTFGDGCAAVVIKPFPLQFSAHPNRSSRARPEPETQMDMASFVGGEKAAFAKLRKYWKQLGFRRIGKTEYFALDLQSKQPGYEELLR